MANPFPPDSPPVNFIPLRTPLQICTTCPTSPHVHMNESKDYGKFFTFLYNAAIYLLQRPVILSGAAASRPNATLYPQNSLYCATDTHHIYLCNYATPGVASTATWNLLI